MYRDAVRWFAAEHLLTVGQPTDIDSRFATDADKRILGMPKCGDRCANKRKGAWKVTEILMPV